MIKEAVKSALDTLETVLKVNDHVSKDLLKQALKQEPICFYRMAHDEIQISIFPKEGFKPLYE